MAAPKLNSAQINRIKELLASDETQAVIAKEIECHIQTVRYYAQKYAEEIEQARKKFNEETINKGFANKEYRIRKLAGLARRIEASIEEEGNGGKGIWVDDIKMAGNGDTVDIKSFAGEAIRQYRGILDDIAKEKGERVTKAEIDVKGNILAEFVNLEIDKI